MRMSASFSFGQGRDIKYQFKKSNFLKEKGQTVIQSFVFTTKKLHYRKKQKQKKKRVCEWFQLQDSVMVMGMKRKSVG